ncbi:MAG: bifunctional folylpolyglutamate synthase/dihydrofolate synthase [Eubacterium sp.]|jgi:dihydrofolate synthase/folylpolyglutamate synthase
MSEEKKKDENQKRTMTYEEALTWLNAPKYSQTRPGLKPVTELMRRLGNPQDGLKYVHIAGTNGKGSTAAFIEQVLRSAGYRTGLYTSPYLEHFTERIRVCGEEIAEQDVARLTEKVREKSEEMAADGWAEPTVFEMVTAVAFLYFREQNCEAVVLEVGMGGRLDATNIIHPEDKAVSVITKLGYDHMKFLGNTLAEIAHEKAGIILDGVPAVSAPQAEEARKVLEQAAEEHHTEIQFIDQNPECLLREGSSAALKAERKGQAEVQAETDEIKSLLGQPLSPVMKHADLDGQTYVLPDGEEMTIGLLGVYQMSNSLTALAAVRVLQKQGWKISEEALQEGFRKTRWKGRFELVSHHPAIIIDGAHNPDGVQSLRESLENLFPGRKFTFITGVLADKDYSQMYEIITPIAKRFLTVTPDCDRALASSDLAEFLKKSGVETIDCGTPEEAVDLCVSDYPDERICSFGSLYYIGSVREYCGELGLR